MVEAGGSGVPGHPPLRSKLKASSGLHEILSQLTMTVWGLLTACYILSTSLSTVWTVPPLNLQKASFRLTAAILIPSERPHNLCVEQVRSEVCF